MVLRERVWYDLMQNQILHDILMEKPYHALIKPGETSISKFHFDLLPELLNLAGRLIENVVGLKIL